MSETSSLDDRAQEVLELLPAAAPGSIVIGGWASWLRTRAQRSHDVDLIVDHQQLAAIGEHARIERSSAQHAGAQKWVADWDGVHLDLYVPFQSRLGTRLELRVEKLAQHTEQVDGQTVLTIGGQTAAKWAALVDRQGTRRGAKDREELLELLRDPAAADARHVLHEASNQPAHVVDAAIRDGLDYLAAGAERIERRRLQRLAKTWLPDPVEAAPPAAAPARGTTRPGGRPPRRAQTKSRRQPPPPPAGPAELPPAREDGIEL